MILWVGIAILASLVIIVRLYSSQYYKYVKLLPMIFIIGYFCIESEFFPQTKFFLQKTTLIWILLGLILGAIGDFCLLKKDNQFWFLGGLIFFLLGHIAYIDYIFSLEFNAKNIFWPMVIPLIMFNGIYLYFMINLLKQKKKKIFIVPIILYMIVISSLVVFNISYELTNFNTLSHLSIAAVLFLISDSLLGINTFDQYRPVVQFLVLATYYTSQGFFVQAVS